MVPDVSLNDGEVIEGYGQSSLSARFPIHLDGLFVARFCVGQVSLLFQHGGAGDEQAGNGDSIASFGEESFGFRACFVGLLHLPFCEEPNIASVAREPPTSGRRSYGPSPQ